MAAAYEELEAQGWITALRGKGSFVSSELPEATAQPPRALSMHGAPAFPLEAPPARRWQWPSPARGVLSMTGAADARLLPLAELGRAYRRAASTLRETAGHYAIGRGHPRLVAALKDMLATRRSIERDRGLLVTRGSQMGLFLLIEALFEPGDAVAVEDPGYEFCWPAFRRRRVELLPVPVDGEGLRVDVLAQIVARRPVRAVLVTPATQYPTTATLSAARREALLAIAAERRLMVVEDDALHEHRYSGPPQLPLASEDRRGVVVYLGSLSKVWMPSVRLGYVVGPERLIDLLADVRRLVDVCGDPVLEVAMAELIEEGDLQRHVHRVRKVLHARRDALASALQTELKGAVRFRVPDAGAVFWVEVDDAIDAVAWAERGLERGVAFVTGERFFLGPSPGPRLLLSFATLDESELREAVRRMARALRDLRAAT